MHSTDPKNSKTLVPIPKTKQVPKCKASGKVMKPNISDENFNLNKKNIDFWISSCDLLIVTD